MPGLASLRVGNFRYNSPWTQVVVVGFVCFCSVGMFSALGNLGAGGINDVQLSDTANAVLYTLFAITGFFAGSINNLLGPRLTLSLGTTGYALYVGSLWAYQLHGTGWFFILAGAILGVTAALLWAAEGAIMMSYPLEKDKGRSFSLFWAIFQLGTLIGSAITLSIEANSTLHAVSNSVYIAFMIIMLTSIVTSWGILPPSAVVRGDGTVVELEAARTVVEELKSFAAQFKDWRMVALFPMFFSSNYFYAYQGAITAFLFNARTRALVSLLTGLGSIVGSIFIGVLLDRLPFKRRARSLIGCATVAVMLLGIWGGGLGFQVTFNRNSDHTPWDWTVPAAAGPIVLIMFYYIGDAAYQGLAYYTMSAMTNDPFKLARMAGYYKGVQSAGAAVSFGMDAVKTPYLTEHLVSWLMMMFSLPFCALVLYKIRESNYEVEKVIHVEDVQDGGRLETAAMPQGHHLHAHTAHVDDKEKAEVAHV